MPELFVTNFNRNITGVGSTIANLVPVQAEQFDMRLVGYPLEGCPAPISVAEARELSQKGAEGRPFPIWHVRRNTEMRSAIWARDVLGLPIKVLFTSAAQHRHSMFPRWLISRMDAVIATTPKAAGLVPHVRAVVPHGVVTRRFTPAEDRAAAWAALGYGGTMGIATIGRVRPEKGTDAFVGAMIDLLPTLPGAVALVVGKATRQHAGFEAALKAQVAQAGLSDRIIFTGLVPHDTLLQIMKAASLVMQLPRGEGFGIVPQEAMASGTPFLATDAGAYADLAANSNAGRIVTPSEASDAARAILTDPDRLAAMSRAARIAAETRYSIETEAAGIAAVYEEIWAGGA